MKVSQQPCRLEGVCADLSTGVEAGRQSRGSVEAGRRGRVDCGVLLLPRCAGACSFYLGREVIHRALVRCTHAHKDKELVVDGIRGRLVG